MKFLVSITTIVLVFAMNRFHEDYFKDANNLFEEIGYKNLTEVFKIDLKIRNLIEVFKERQKNRTRKPLPKCEEVQASRLPTTTYMRANDRLIFLHE